MRGGRIMTLSGTLEGGTGGTAGRGGTGKQEGVGGTRGRGGGDLIGL